MDYEAALNEKIAIVGHGQFGYTLFNRLFNSGISTFHLNHKDKIPEKITIIINCVPAKHQHKLLQSQRDSGFSGIVIDTSQTSIKPTSNTISPTQLFLKDEFYAKAFGDLSSYDFAVINRQAKQTFIYAKSAKVFNTIASITKLMNIEPVFVSPKTKNLEMLLNERYNRNFPNSLTASIFSGIVFIIAYTYMFVRAVPPVGNHNFDDMIMHELQNVCAWVSVTLFSSCFVLGSIGKLLPKPIGSRIFISLLNSRAQIGLYAAAFAFLHVLMMVVEFNESSYGKYYYPDSNDMQWWAQLIILFGALASLFIIPMVISSFSGQWSRKEWFLLQPICGFFVIIFAGSHVTIIGLPPNKDGWRDLFGGSGMPSPSFFAGLACYLAIGFRVLVFVVGKCCGLPKDKGLQGYMKVGSETKEDGITGVQNEGFA